MAYKITDICVACGTAFPAVPALTLAPPVLSSKANRNKDVTTKALPLCRAFLQQE